MSQHGGPGAAGAVVDPVPPEVSASELASVLGTAGAPFLVDVREPDEYAGWSIPGAHNLPLSVLESAGDASLSAVPRAGQVVVVCASGRRSARAAELLRAAGVQASNLAGGMAAWSGVYDVARVVAGPLEIVQLRRRGKGCLSYVVGADGEALVVDPSADVDRYVDAATDRGWRITGVVDTHLHADHVSGARALAEAIGAFVYRSEGDPVRFPFEPVGQGARIRVGRSGVAVRTAPGHTEGSIVLEAPDGSLLTGDTLFVDGVGRPDLADHAEADARALYRTLASLLEGRPDTTAVYPAHYGEQVRVLPGVPVSATLGEILASVPQLSWDEDRFVAWASGRAVPRPPRYQDIVRVNTGEQEVSVEECRALEVGPNRCAAA